MNAALELQGVTASYGEVVALRNVSFRAEPGRITTVLGANGAGKTTLLKTISGVVRPNPGTVLLHGEPIVGHAPQHLVRKGLVHVPEGRGVIDELTVDENLRLSTLWRRDRAEARQDIREIYERFEALDRRRRQPGASLSGGERQILAIARALLCHPRVLLLDEPSLGLAPLMAQQIMALVRDLVDEGGLSVLLVEQNARSALSIADEAVVLSIGSVVRTGRSDEVLGDPDFRKTYLGI